MQPALDRLYRRAEYEILTPEAHITLKIDVPCPALVTLHQKWKVRGSALLTAWNPHSVPQSESFNSDAQEQLRQRIVDLGLNYLPGCSRDPAGEWPAEPSFCVLGLALENARRLGADFGQNALLHATAEGVPRLIWV